MADLVVELYGREIGRLRGRTSRAFDFAASASAIRELGLGSTILSQSVPLELVPNRARAARRRNYFAELLPEGALRTDLAHQAGLSESDIVGLLARYGRDVAGAVQIWDPELPGEPRVPFTTPISELEIGGLLRDTTAFPLGNAPTTGKSLLNGVQTKILLVRQDAQWLRPGDGFPSTHILKPRLDETSTTVFDEEYGARISRMLGLATYSTTVERFDGIDCLVVERYDRSSSSPDGRIHQEDMNQALGASGNEKYQRLGGKVSLRRIAEVVVSAGDLESLLRLARIVVVATALGNLDLHAKNLSLLHPHAGRRTLAPVYDMVPMTHLDNDGEMALAVNGVYAHAGITAADLGEELSSWGLPRARLEVDETLARLAEIVSDEAPLPGSWRGLQDDVARFVGNLRGGKPAN